MALELECRIKKRDIHRNKIQKNIDSNFSPSECRAIEVQNMVNLVEEYLPDNIKDQLHYIHLQFSRVNFSDTEP